MTESDFDWMVSTHALWGWNAPVKATMSDVSQPSALPLSRFHLSPFPQKLLILRLTYLKKNKMDCICA